MGKSLSSEEKVQAILDGMTAGETRDDLAMQLGYKDWRGIDVLMRRQGYVLVDGLYVQREEPQGDIQDQEKFTPRSVQVVLREISSGNNDLNLIAQKAGFTTRKDLADYMKAQGWRWSAEEETYIKQNASEGADEDEVIPESPRTTVTNEGPKGQKEVQLEPYLPLLEFLMANQDQLEALLSPLQTGQIPQYRFFAGQTMTKSVSMSSNLDRLVKDFSTEMGVSQRNIFEAALIQFMERYGYAKQVKAFLEK